MTFNFNTFISRLSLCKTSVQYLLWKVACIDPESFLVPKKGKKEEGKQSLGIIR